MGGGGAESVDTIPDWAKPYYEDFLKKSDTLFGEGGMGKTDPLETIGENELIRFALNDASKGKNILGSAMDDMYSISQGADPIDTEALKNAATLRAKQEMVPITQMHGGIGSSTAGVGGGRQQLDQSDAANRLAAQFADFDYQAKSEALAREDAARAGLGTAFKDYAGAGTFGGDLLKEIGGERADADYEELMKLRDLIDFRQPTQTAVQGGK